MNKNDFYAVIMAGGAGTRLWPASRQKSPKQFQKLTGRQSLFQQTVSRVRSVVRQQNIFVSLGKKDYSSARRQLPHLPQKNFIIEPIGKNTAPAIGLATLLIRELNPSAIIATLAADHEIQKKNNFAKDLKLSFRTVAQHPQFIATIGLKPTYPETGYGYIKTGEIFQSVGERAVLRVQRFVEKPDQKTAQKYLDSGEYLWNASYFIFGAGNMLSLFEKHSAKISGLLKKIKQNLSDRNETARLFLQMPSIPIDTAIMEKVDKIVVIPADLGWSDVGSWQSVYEILSQKLNLTEVVRGRHIGHNDKNIFVLGEKKMIATAGLDNIAIVDTKDALLVLNKNNSQDVKKLVEKLKDRGETKYL